MHNLIVLILSVFFSCTKAWSLPETSQIHTTTTHLQQLKAKIVRLQTALTQEEQKRQHLDVDLQTTAHQLQHTQTQLVTLQRTLAQTQRNITALQTELSTLQQQRQTLQNRLAEQLTTLYHLSQPSHRPLHPQPRQTQVYLRYFVQANHTLLTQLNHSNQQLNEKAQVLQATLRKQQSLQQHYLAQQHTLQTEQTAHTEALASTHLHLQHMQHILSAYQQDQATLTRLLQTLTTQSVIQTRYSFAHMQHKLTTPLHLSHLKRQKHHQGVFFEAPLQTPVYAVYPGKVVFSNWLNGYGFLLIVDHGWGFMTVYAHNQALLKQVGDSVAAQDHIASVGQTGTLKQSGLYFEIRHHGKPISPLTWLS